MLSTAGAGGGAPRAMRRLALGLSGRGHETTIIQLAGQAGGGPDSIVVGADPATRDVDAVAAADFIDHDDLRHRFTGPNTFFDVESRGLDLTRLPDIERYDVFNLHWTNYLLNPETIAPLIALGRPVVFTLHDMGHFTGGCHYAGHCDGYTGDCIPCWQLSDDGADLTGPLLAAKRRSYRQAGVAAVAPSNWLAGAAASSGVFRAGAVHWISNGVETDIFRPIDKFEARRRLGLAPGRRSILFGAHYNNEDRKGFPVLLAALQRLRSDLEAMDEATAESLELLVFGEATPEVSALGIDVKAFGAISDDEHLAAIYNAADLVVLPSLEDNQPNIMLEAMASGVPVVASAVGGMKDVIRDDINGRLVPPRDPAALAAAIRDLVVDPEATLRLGRTARLDIIEHATLAAQASRYEALFRLLLRTAAPARLSEIRNRPSSDQDIPRDPQRIFLPEQVAPRILAAAALAEDLARSAEEQQRGRADFDVSIVLNLHDERRYVTRTLLSITEAAAFARSAVMSVEIVVVLDRPAAGMVEWLDEADLSAFDGASRHVVDFGSLGLARNHGLQAARGTYVMTADGDDLISFNSIWSFFQQARDGSPREIYYPRYYYSFGDQFHIFKLLSLDAVSPLPFIDHHPYGSRIFCLRELALEIGFEDLRLTRGFAFEDWHFNITALAHGVHLTTVPDTIVFYRQRHGGLMRAADALSVRLPPPSPFFDPPVYRRVCAPFIEALRHGRQHFVTEEEIRHDFRASPTLRELTIAAAAIEPAIDVERLDGIYTYANANGDTRPGAAYYDACGVIGDGTFTDVLLASSLDSRDDATFIVEVIDALLRLDPSRRLLVITAGESGAGAHAWPDTVVLLDLFAIYRALEDSHREVATLRLLQSVARGAALHLRSDPFVSGFIRRFGFLLGDMRMVLYRFQDAVATIPEGRVLKGGDWDFLSECGALFEIIVADHWERGLEDGRLLDTLAGKYWTLHRPIDLPKSASREDERQTRRMLWVDAPAGADRSNLLPAIERALAAAKLDVTIHAVNELPDDDSDGLIYAASAAGLPSVILEAMAAGLVVVAPDIGGIGEAVTPETGFLIPDSPDTDSLAEAYVAAIARFYDPVTDRAGIRGRARALIAENHDRERFTRDVGRLFEGAADAETPRKPDAVQGVSRPHEGALAQSAPSVIENDMSQTDATLAGETPEPLAREFKRLNGELQALRHRLLVYQAQEAAALAKPVQEPDERSAERAALHDRIATLDAERAALADHIAALEAEVASLQGERAAANRILASRHRTWKHLLRLYRRKLFGTR